MVRSALGAGLCVAALATLAVATGCSNDSLRGSCVDCPPGSKCVQGVCRDACANDDGCDSNQVCLEGACWERVAVGGDGPTGGGDSKGGGGDTSGGGGDSNASGGDEALAGDDVVLVPGDGTCATGSPVVAWPDRDSDGYTEASETICVDGSLPSTHRAASHPPPLVSFGAGTATESGSGRSWSNEDRARVPPGHASAELESGASRELILTDFGLAVPGGATIRGVHVWVRRRYRERSGVRDHTVRLVLAGTPAGENKADTATNWPLDWGTASYGGDGDLWDLALTPADVNDPGFGVVLRATYPGSEDAKAEVGQIWVGIYLEGATDCNDDLQSAYTEISFLTDNDGDGFGVGAVQTACSDADALPSNTASPATGEDCYDANDKARPIETGWHPVHRGDGSFDYNCDTTEEKNTVGEDTSCDCNTTTWCAANRNSFLPTTDCGIGNTVDECQGTCGTCALVPVNRPTECR